MVIQMGSTKSELLKFYRILMFPLCFFSLAATAQLGVPYYIDIKGNEKTDEKKLSSLGSTIEFIPLETTSESLINEIRDIELTDSYIFLSEIDRLLQFDKYGKFIRQIGSYGRGPQEYLSVIDFCIDKQDNEVHILSPDKRMVFGMDGHFIKSYKMSTRPSQILYIDRDKYIYHLFNIPGQNSNYLMSWIITNKEGNQVNSFRNHLIRRSSPGLIVGDTPLYLFEGLPHMLEFGIDTLFFVKGDKLLPYAIFDLGEWKMDPDPIISPGNKEMISSILKDMLYIKALRENGKYLFIEIGRGLSGSSIHFLFNKITGETLFLNKNGFTDDLNCVISFWPKFIFNDFICTDYAESLELIRAIDKKLSEGLNSKRGTIPGQLMNLRKRISEYSNPVLILVK